MELTITTANFENDALNSDIPVLVDFYADWCGPCKMMAPIVETISEKYEGKLKVGKCNVDDERDIAMRYRIMSIPTIMVFKNGDVALKLIGAMSEQELEDKLAEVL